MHGSIYSSQSDGPLNERRYDYPSFVFIEFYWKVDKSNDSYCWNNVFAGGRFIEEQTKTIRPMSEFRMDCGPIETLLDHRCDWCLTGYIERTIRLKYAGATFRFMFREANFVVRCRVYSQQDGDYVEFDYIREYDDFLLTKDHRYWYSENGDVVDWVTGGDEQGITIKRIAATDGLKHRWLNYLEYRKVQSRQRSDGNG